MKKHTKRTRPPLDDLSSKEAAPLMAELFDQTFSGLMEERRRPFSDLSADLANALREKSPFASNMVATAFPLPEDAAAIDPTEADKQHKFLLLSTGVAVGISMCLAIMEGE